MTKLKALLNKLLNREEPRHEPSKRVDDAYNAKKMRSIVRHVEWPK